MSAELVNEYVTWRELITALDARDVKITAQVFDVARRIETLDTHGSRGLQRVSDRLDRAVTELERHSQEHRETIKAGASGKQWLITTLIAAAALLVVLWDKLPT